MTTRILDIALKNLTPPTFQGRHNKLVEHWFLASISMLLTRTPFSAYKWLNSYFEELPAFGSALPLPTPTIPIHGCTSSSVFYVVSRRLTPRSMPVTGYTPYDKQAHEPKAKQLFFQGLKPKIQEHLASPKQRVDLETVMADVEDLDNTRFRHRPTYDFQDSHYPVPESDPEPMEIDAMDVQRQPRTSRPKDLKRIGLANRACFRCHKPGHQARQCPINSSSEILSRQRLLVH
ncbi:hypothetical protein BGX21_005106 [Mortierella sp. AD011]|nr:hypothetical protein BGX20_003739 [Mortierella sp. AD010]KAF9403349.1 hypothetical protein BGX21_005106 [Mortierella sp. AD011]